VKKGVSGFRCSSEDVEFVLEGLVFWRLGLPRQPCVPRQPLVVLAERAEGHRALDQAGRRVDDPQVPVGTANLGSVELDTPFTLESLVLVRWFLAGLSASFSAVPKPII
jgi:hypothetical protein